MTEPLLRIVAVPIAMLSCGAAVETVVHLDERTQLHHQRSDPVLVAAGQQRRELVTADAGGDVGAPDGLAEHLGGTPDQVVPGGVSELVVGLLEAVQICDQDAHDGRLSHLQRADDRVEVRTVVHDP